MDNTICVKCLSPGNAGFMTTIYPAIRIRGKNIPTIYSQRVASYSNHIYGVTMVLF